MDTGKLNDLLKKYNNQTATAEERKAVEDWYERINGEVPEMDTADLAGTKADMFNFLEHHIAPVATTAPAKSRLRIYRSYLAKAAVFAGLLLGIAYFFFKKPANGDGKQLLAHQNIQPGGNNAVLQLANGTKVVLNQAADGQISSQQGISIVKTKSGELVYHLREQAGANAYAMNTVTTPHGGQYHLILVDRTEVWLNSGSSITFPAAFSGKERKVKITGEAYFEVAKNKAKPFVVQTGKSEITVLGTHFNVNAYSDEEAEATTLLEGAVSVKSAGQQVLLKPGQQASLQKNASRLSMHEVEDADAAVAWKNGYFQFDNADPAAVMRQISRWYNVDVQYQGALPVKQYNGKIPRGVSAKELVEMLSYSGINCTLQNNRIIVIPK